MHLENYYSNSFSGLPSSRKSIFPDRLMTQGINHKTMAQPKRQSNANIGNIGIEQ